MPRLFQLALLIFTGAGGVPLIPPLCLFIKLFENSTIEFHASKLWRRMPLVRLQAAVFYRLCGFPELVEFVDFRERKTYANFLTLTTTSLRYVRSF